MTENEIYKSIQKAMEKPPLILVGSGGSAPYGLPNMTELGNHLKHSLNKKYISDYNWNKFVENLDHGQDLESALTDLTLSDEIIDDIRIETWNLISRKDLELFEQVVFNNKKLPIGYLLKIFYQSHPKRVNVITTNYDRVIEYACDSVNLPICTGFYGLYAKRFIHSFKNSDSINIVKVHGSLDDFRDIHGDTIGIPLLNRLKPGLIPEIITPGLSKYRSVLKGSIRERLHVSDELIDKANSFLCIGYGFNDEHIQEKILTRIHQGIPIVVITKKLSDTAMHLIIEKAKNYIILEEGAEDNTTSVCINKEYSFLRECYWSIEGFMKIID